MTYTAEQQKQIKKNVEQIKQYLINIAPELGDRLEMSFVGERKYTLTVTNYNNAPDVYGWMGSNIYINFNETERTIKGSGVCDRYAWDVPDFCIALFKNWENIKQQIGDEIERNKQNAELIANFEI